jgi:hypothetical protein
VAAKHLTTVKTQYPMSTQETLAQIQVVVAADIIINTPELAALVVQA